MIIGGGVMRRRSTNPLLKCKESEEIQCPNVKLSDIYSVTFHTRIVGNKLVGEFKQFGTDSGISIGNCAIAGVHVGLQNFEVVNSSGSRHRSVVVNFVNCSRSEAVLPRQCRPGGSGRRMNLSTIADPYDLAGGDVAGDVENHGRWWW
jgi:hypothetical protein